MKFALPLVAFCALALCLRRCSAFVIAQPVTKPAAYPNRIVFIRHAEKGFVPDANQSTSSGNANEGREHQGSKEWHHKKQKKSGFWPPWGGGDDRRPPGGPDGRGRPGWPGRKFPSGLNDKGRERAQFLRQLFGEESEFDFGKIFAAPRELPKETERTYATVAPLAEDLGLEVDIDCANSPASCIVEKINAFAEKSEKDILISWKHRDLNVIATALGAPNAKIHYPDERYDILWIMEDGQIVEKRSMHCPVLDDDRVDEGDPDLIVEDASSRHWFWALVAALKSGFSA